MVARSAASGARSISGSTSKRWRSGRSRSPAATWATSSRQAPPVQANRRGMLPELLSQIPPDQEIASVTADGAYDTRKCHDAIAERGAHAVIPPRKNAKPWKTETAGAAARNEALRASKYLGRALWRRWSGYHRRSRAETKMHCVKLLGQRLMAVRHRPRTGGGTMPHPRPPGRGVPGPCCRTERLHRSRHPRHEGRGIGLPGRRRTPAISRFVQQSSLKRKERISTEGFQSHREGDRSHCSA